MSWSGLHMPVHKTFHLLLLGGTIRIPAAFIVFTTELYIWVESCTLNPSAIDFYIIL